MAGRPIASVTISFGLVSIPVQLFTAAESSGHVSFNLLHAGCGSRLRQQYVCLRDGEIVERAQMSKGYEFAKSQYVEFSPEELKALSAVGTDSVDIAEFVPLSSIDPIYFDKTYFLSPDRGGAKPYALLANALAESNRCAVGSWASKGKQHTVALRSAGRLLIMQQLFFASEVRSGDEIELPDVVLKDAERKLALQLIEQQSSEAFDASTYKDDVKQRIDAAIAEKVAGKEISVSEAPRAVAGNVIDLMEVLRKSLKAPSAAKQRETQPRKPTRSAPGTSTRTKRSPRRSS